MSETKKWFLKTLEGEKVYFYPVFIVDSQNNIECQRVVIKIDENKYTFNFLDLLMFVYFIGDDSVSGPKSVEEWNAALTVMKKYLGLSTHKLAKYMAEVFIDLKQIGL